MDAALGFFGLASPCDISLTFDDTPARRYITPIENGFKPFLDVHKKPKTTLERIPLFTETESVSGRVTISVKEGKQVSHNGITIEFVGTIEMLYDKENSQEFTSLLRDLDNPGTLQDTRQYDFVFTNVEKAFDTYSGINVKLRYFIRVTIARASYASNITKEFDIAVQHLETEPPTRPIRMEVGIEDALHLEFEYNKDKFHLDDVVIGKIYFLLVRIRVKRMEVEIRKKESAGTGANIYNEMDTLLKFEVMDGSPVRTECIPVRLFLNGCKNLTPTYRNVNNKFTVKYYLNLVLVDEDDRRYFKQSEIELWRASYTTGKSLP